MKQRNLSICILTILFFLLYTQVIFSQEAKPVLVIPESDFIPEGITFDPRTESFFIGSTFKRKILRVHISGKISDFTKPTQDGLLGILGMRVDPASRNLWVLSTNAGFGMPMQDLDTTLIGTSYLHQYHIDTQSLINTFKVGNRNERSFLNDLTLAKDGSVYITDSSAKRIYKLNQEKQSLEVFYQLDDEMAPNGIDISDDQKVLFVAVYGGHNMIRINLKNRSLKVMSLPEGESMAADGLYFYKNSIVAIQPWNKDRRIARYLLSKNLNEVEKVIPLATNNPHFIQPTTGVIINDSIFCIANSQLQVFSKLFSQENYSLDQLKDPVILGFPVSRDK